MGGPGGRRRSVPAGETSIPAIPQIPPRAAPCGGEIVGTMEPDHSPAPRARDAAIRRLRRLTAGISGAAAGAVALLALVSAATVPGHQAASTAATTGSAASVLTATTTSS